MARKQAVRSHPGSHLSLILCLYKHPMPRASKARSVQKAIISFIARTTRRHPIIWRNNRPVRASPEVKPSLSTTKALPTFKNLPGRKMKASSFNNGFPRKKWRRHHLMMASPAKSEAIII
jgi:hypothetical protein